MTVIETLSYLDAIELAAIRRFAELHTGGCQSPHGGRCACGWNLIDARLEELHGSDASRVAFLRQSVQFAYDEDRERAEETLAEIEQAVSRAVESVTSRATR